MTPRGSALRLTKRVTSPASYEAIGPPFQPYSASRRMAGRIDTAIKE